MEVDIPLRLADWVTKGRKIAKEVILLRCVLSALRKCRLGFYEFQFQAHWEQLYPGFPNCFDVNMK
jgi:hypothetical protein